MAVSKVRIAKPRKEANLRAARAKAWIYGACLWPKKKWERDMKDESLNLIRRLENRLKDVQIEIKEANAKILILEAKHERARQLKRENQELRRKGKETLDWLNQGLPSTNFGVIRAAIFNLWGVK